MQLLIIFFSSHFNSRTIFIFEIRKFEKFLLVQTPTDNLSLLLYPIEHVYCASESLSD